MVQFDQLYELVYIAGECHKGKIKAYPAIHTNYSLSTCTISNWKDLNRSSEILVIN